MEIYKHNKIYITTCLFVFILPPFILSIHTPKCNGGANCMPLNQCTGLYKQLQQGSSPTLTELLRGLHCGFDASTTNAVPKICCPPEFLNLIPSERVCGIQNNDRIVGGTQTDIDEHPWMALLRYDKPSGWGFYCGGVLISSRYILTAAHCVKGSDLPVNWKLSQVRLGEWNTSSSNDCLHGDCTNPVVDVPIEKTIAHEFYNPDDQHQQNDIALLRLSKEVPFNDFVKPICLPVSASLRKATFEDFEVAGWGKTETQETAGSHRVPVINSKPTGTESDVKLKVRVPYVSSSECANTYEKVERKITETQLCAGGLAGRDSCRGDSGGALMGQTSSANNWFVMGVVSYGPTPCGTEGWPGVYTRVGAFMDWILLNMKP